jgi:DNA-directed RNA polymerase sigma subunit (sigma70/sigma32)
MSMGTLTPREQRVLQLRFARDGRRTLEEVVKICALERIHD